MGNFWVALGWSAAVLPAWLAVRAIGPRLEPYGTLGELAAFAAAWYVGGSLLSNLIRVVLRAMGLPTDASDPAETLRETDRLAAAGRIPAAEAGVRRAACLIALQRPGEALDALDAADAAGARTTHREAARFLRARALEGVGRDAEARDLYAAIHADESMPAAHRMAARLRSFAAGLRAEPGAAASPSADLSVLAAGPGCRPCRRSASRAGLGDDELEFLADTLAEVGADRRAAPEALAAADLLLASAGSGRGARSLRQVRSELAGAAGR